MGDVDDDDIVGTFFNEKPERILLLFFLALAVTAGQMSQGRPGIILIKKLVVRV